MRNDAEGAGPRTAASAGLIDKLEADRVDALVAMGQALRTIELADRDRAAAEREYRPTRSAEQKRPLKPPLATRCQYDQGTDSATGGSDHRQAPGP